MIAVPVNVTEDLIDAVIQKFQSDKEPISFLVNVRFYFNQPEDFGLDLGRFPIRMENDITNEELHMHMGANNVLVIERMPNDIVDLLDDYLYSLWNLPSIKIGKWVCFLLDIFF